MELNKYMELNDELKDLEKKMNDLGEKILKDKNTAPLHNAIWGLKDRADEIRRIRKDTKVSKQSTRS